MVRGADAMWKASRALACALTAATIGCAGSGATQADEQEIIAGTPATGYPEAVVVNALAADKPTASCSGVLIAPRAVLTAGHCVDGYRGWGVLAPYGGGQSAMSYDAAVYDWTSGLAFTFDQHDVAIVFLPEDIVLDEYPIVGASAVAEGTPAVSIGRVSDGFVSDEALFVSQTFALSPDLKLPDASHPYHYGSLYRTVQKGDSGGPVMLPGSQPREVVALNSSYHFYARLDIVHAWITEQLAAHGSPTE